MFCMCVHITVFQNVCIYITYRDAESRPHFLWVDNFSKFISRSIPTADKGVFSQCLWTGVSIFTLPSGSGSTISDTVQFDDAGNVIPAMPRDILQYQDGVIGAINYVLTLGPKYYTEAAVTKYDVRNVPLKVDTNILEDVKADVDSYNMKCVRPTDLIEHNIGSNRGLLTVLDIICRDRNIHGDEPCTRYTTFNVDENIFWRILKVNSILFLVKYTVSCCMSSILLERSKSFSKILRDTATTKIFEKDFGSTFTFL